MNINAIICPTCKYTVFSRARHDMRYCHCGEVYIDRGFEYQRVGWTKEMPVSVEIEVDQTKNELYDDWNKNIDKYGLIAPV